MTLGDEHDSLVESIGPSGAVYVTLFDIIFFSKISILLSYLYCIASPPPVYAVHLWIAGAMIVCLFAKRLSRQLILTPFGLISLIVTSIYLDAYPEEHWKTLFMIALFCFDLKLVIVEVMCCINMWTRPKRPPGRYANPVVADPEAMPCSPNALQSD
jgi:hypothetical protein